jgi:hypothetical protein
MTKSRSPSGSSGRRKRRGTPSSSGPPASDAGDVLQHLLDIESQLRELTADRPANSDDVSGTHPESAIDRMEGIEQAIQRQAASLHVMAEGLQKFQQRLSTEVVEAIQTAASRTNCSEAMHDSVSATPSAAEQRPTDPRTPPAGDSSVDSSWAMIRQAMLDSSDEECESSMGVGEVPEPEIVEEVLPPSPQAEESWERPQLVEFNVPEPFDCETIEDEALRSAFREREEILRQLSARLRQRLQPVSGISTEQLLEMAESFPEDLRERVTLSLGQLDEQLRLTELELSLERAKMARQMKRMEDTRNIVESAARRLGYSVTADGKLEGTPHVVDPKRSGGRWMRVLGFGR